MLKGEGGGVVWQWKNGILHVLHISYLSFENFVSINMVKEIYFCFVFTLINLTKENCRPHKRGLLNSWASNMKNGTPKSNGNDYLKSQSVGFTVSGGFIPNRFRESILKMSFARKHVPWN